MFKSYIYPRDLSKHKKQALLPSYTLSRDKVLILDFDQEDGTSYIRGIKAGSKFVN